MKIEQFWQVIELVNKDALTKGDETEALRPLLQQLKKAVAS